MLSPDKQALKRAARRLYQAVGGQEKAAGLCRVGQARLSAYGGPNNPDEFMPVDVVADLEEVTEGAPGAPHVTRELARQRGYELVPLPGAKPEGKSWAQHIADLAKESGDIISKLAPASVDGVCKHDIVERELLREARELIQASVELAAALEAVMADTG